MTSPSTRVAGLAEVSRTAMTRMAELLGVPAEPVSGPAPLDGGPHLHMETVELERIPPSTSILGTYEVETDEHGNVLSLRRFRRHTRGEAGQT